MPALSAVYLYDEGTAPALDAGSLAGYLSERLACPPVALRPSFLAFHAEEGSRPALSERIAALKVRDVSAPPSQTAPAYGEIEFERRRLASDDRGAFGVLYDGFGFQRLLRGLLPPQELRLDRLHLVLTNRTLATWDEDDLRFHLRTVVLGIPPIISTTGLVEAPARPREFYLAQQRLAATARPEMARALLEEQFRGQFLNHDDPRLTEVVKGYAIQAALYQVAGEAFCDDPDCRLFNAHWQAELIRAHLGGGREYCARHEELLAAFRRGDV